MCPPVPVSTFICAFPIVSEGSLAIQDEPAFFISCPQVSVAASHPLPSFFPSGSTTLHPLLTLYLFPPPSFLDELPVFPSTQYYFILQPTVVRILPCLKGMDFTFSRSTPVRDASCGLTLLACRCYQLNLPLSISKIDSSCNLWHPLYGSSNSKLSRKVRTPPPPMPLSYLSKAKCYPA